MLYCEKMEGYIMLDLTEKTLQSHEVYSGRIIRVRNDEVLLPNGEHGWREVVDHPGGVGILAFDDQGRVALVRQFRYAVGQHLWEIPAGKREKGENPFVTAQRELNEEVGAAAARWTELGSIIASPGCYAEVLYLYMAEGLSFSRQHLDEDEFLEVRFFPFAEAVEKCMSGEIRDGKTVTAVLKARLLQEKTCTL